MQEAYALGRTVSREHFRVKPRGGEGTAQHLGVIRDAWQSVARGDKSKTFATSYFNQLGWRLNIKLYTNDGALACAKYVCDKFSYYYDIFLADGGTVPYVFDGSLVLIEPPDFAAFRASMRNPIAVRRLALITALVPVGDGT